MSFTCSQAGWFRRDHEVVLSSSHKSVYCHEGGGTVNLQGSQIQQKTMNSGSLLSLSKTDVHHTDLTYSPGYSTRTAKEHRNPLIPAHFALTNEKIKQILKGKENRLPMMMSTEVGMTFDTNLWSWPSPSYGYT